MKVDLHLHTTASDGRLSPAELVQLALNQGLHIIAVTDHDTVNGIVPALSAAQASPSLKVIPGVEISTDIPRGEVHILGYFIEYTDPELLSVLERMRDSRRLRANRIIEKLADMDIHVDMEHVQKLAGTGSIGRPHIAQAMLDSGYITSFGEAFDKYIGRNGPAYAEREKLTPEESVQLIVKSKGLPVLAHPADIEEIDILLIKLISVGLIGMEVYYKDYTQETVDRLLAIADKYQLVPCGGTDYHGLDDNTELLPGGVDVPLKSAERLISLAGHRARSQ